MRLILVIENPVAAPIWLDEGQILGYLHPVTLIKDPAQEGPEKDSDPLVAMIQREDRGEGMSKLLATLAIGETDVTAEELEELKKLVSKFDHLFVLTNGELGRTNIVEHSINTGDHCPVRQPPRRVPFSLRSKLGELVNEMLEQGVIVPSSSPWASPIVLVTKMDGSTRFYADYR